MKTKVLKSSIYGVILAIFSVVSCTDVLDQVNPNTISSDTFWRDGSDALKALMGVYHSAGASYDNYGVVRHFIFWRSDEINPRGSVGTTFFAHSSTPWAHQRAWDVNYSAIKKANDMLANVPDIEMDQTEKNNILGEVLFIRAWAHFELVNMFENVVIQTENAETPEELFPFQSTSSETFTQIIADLTQAETLLQPKGYYPVEFLGRATRGAATALKGKAYLFSQQWSQAATTFQGIMNGEYSLVSNYRDNFMETTEFNEESIYEIPAQNAKDAGAQGWISTISGDNTAFSGEWAQFGGLPGGFSGGGSSTINQWVLDLFLKTPDKGGNIDVRAFESLAWNHPNSILYDGKTFEQIYGDPAQGNDGVNFPTHIDEVFQKKYASIGIKSTNVRDENAFNWRAIRYADVLLMYAEAQNEAVGPDASVYNAINQVRARANMPDIPAGLSEDQMRQVIREERTLELFWEGHRFQDLRRWGTMTEAFLNEHPGSKSNQGVEFQPERDELMPIPQSEIDTNPNAVQNPGFVSG